MNPHTKVGPLNYSLRVKWLSNHPRSTPPEAEWRYMHSHWRLDRAEVEKIQFNDGHDGLFCWPNPMIIVSLYINHAYDEVNSIHSHVT